MQFSTLCLTTLASFGTLFLVAKMIGRVLEDNPKRMGLDLTWLKKQLDQRHTHSPSEVFLAVCDRNLKFVLYEKSHADK